MMRLAAQPAVTLGASRGGKSSSAPRLAATSCSLSPIQGQTQRNMSRALAGAAAAAAIVSSFGLGSPALARPPPSSDPNRCAVENLTKFAGVRAAFSAEISSGALPEAILDLRDCDLSKLKLNEAVLSGAILTGANFEGTSLVHAELSRVSARSANFRGVNLTDANLYEVVRGICGWARAMSSLWLQAFDGSDLRGATFTNSILSSATFGKDSNGVWANLEGVEFEGALLSSSDARQVCNNPTLDDYGKAIIGCR